MMHFLSIDLFALMPMLFFIYGLSFFVLGATISVEKLSLYRSAPSVRVMEFVGTAWGSLAIFGLSYGMYEFMGAFNILYGGTLLSLKFLRFLFLPLSFYFLCRFGVSYGHDRANGGRRPKLPNILAVAWVVLCLSLLFIRGFSGSRLAEAGIASRYLIGIPGSLMAAFALAAYRKDAAAGAGKYLIAASLGFFLFAASLLITSRANFFPVSVLNYEAFYRVAHVPVEVLRMACAILITFALLMYFRLSRNFVSIRFKVVLHVIVAVAVPAFCIILLVSYLMAASLLRMSYTDNERITARTAQKMEDLLRNSKDRIKYDLLYAHEGAAVSARNIVGSLLTDNRGVTGVTFVDGEGEILRAVKNPASGAISYSGTAKGQRMSRVLAALNPQTAVAHFHVAGHDDRSIFFVFPLPVGRIEVGLDLERFFNMTTEDLRMEKSWHVLLLDSKGSLVRHGRGKHLSKRAVFELPGLHRGDYGETTVEDGKLYNAIEEEINPIGWYLMTEIPRQEIVGPVFSVFRGLMLGILAIYLSAVLFAGFVVGRVTRPINLIAERVKSIGRGDLTSTVKIKTGDEIQTLSEEVEKMALMLVEKEETERRMMQTQKIASLGRLVSGVAHEINNPLSVILWTSELLLREFKPGDRRHDDLKMLEKHALACKKIVDDLLRFSRAGKQVDASVDINRSIEETLSLIGKLSRGSKISVNLDFDHSSPKIMGDPDKLRQVFLNMAVNAADAMKKGGGVLTVRTRLSSPGPERSVEITFADTGCGIGPADMERIFDPFFTTKEAGDGTGLGLSVSYGIIAAHHGSMWAESTVGNGSTFHIVLPALEDGGTDET